MKVLKEDTEENGIVGIDLSTGLVPMINAGQYETLIDIPEDAVESPNRANIWDDYVIEKAKPYIVRAVNITPYIESVEGFKYYHPKYYNFETDCIDFTVKLRRSYLNKLIEKALENEDFISWLGKTYQSYPGYINTMAEDAEDFESQEEWRSLAQILRYNLEHSEWDEEDEQQSFEEDVLEGWQTGGGLDGLERDLDYYEDEISEDYKYLKEMATPVDVKRCREILNDEIDWSQVDETGDVDFAIDQLRSLATEGAISEEEYDYIIANWDDLLEDVAEDTGEIKEAKETTGKYTFDDICAELGLTLDYYKNEREEWKESLEKAVKIINAHPEMELTPVLDSDLQREEDYLDEQGLKMDIKFYVNGINLYTTVKKDEPLTESNGKTLTFNAFTSYLKDIGNSYFDFSKVSGNGNTGYRYVLSEPLTKDQENYLNSYSNVEIGSAQYKYAPEIVHPTVILLDKGSALKEGRRQIWEEDEDEYLQALGELEKEGCAVFRVIEDPEDDIGEEFTTFKEAKKYAEKVGQDKIYVDSFTHCYGSYSDGECEEFNGAILNLDKEVVEYLNESLNPSALNESVEGKDYTQLFKEYLDLIEFNVIDLGGGEYALRDRQGGNLGDIESDKFTNAGQILDRLYIYTDDYILKAIEEELGALGEDCPQMFGDIVALVRSDEFKSKHPDADISEWDIDVLDMIANHFDDIDLSKVAAPADDDNIVGTGAYELILYDEKGNKVSYTKPIMVRCKKETLDELLTTLNKYPGRVNYRWEAERQSYIPTIPANQYDVVDGDTAVEDWIIDIKYKNGEGDEN